MGPEENGERDARKREDREMRPQKGLGGHSNKQLQTPVTSLPAAAQAAGLERRGQIHVPDSKIQGSPWSGIFLLPSVLRW